MQGEWLDLAAEMDAKRVIWLQPVAKPKQVQPHLKPDRSQLLAPNIPTSAATSHGNTLPILPGTGASAEPAQANATAPSSTVPAVGNAQPSTASLHLQPAASSGLPHAESSSLPHTGSSGLPPAASSVRPLGSSSALPPALVAKEQAAPSSAAAQQATGPSISAAQPLMSIAQQSTSVSASEDPVAPQGKAAVGHQVAIWWPDDFAWYHGRIQGFQASKGEHLIHYDDNEVEWLNLAKERVQWKDLPGQPMLPDAPPTAAEPASTAAAPPSTDLQMAEEEPSTAVEPAAPAVPRGPVPETVPIVCNNSRATFDVKRTCILLGEGRECTPTEFERLAGKGASKKWKASIRVDKGGGVPGPTMGDWLVDAGLDTAKAVRPKSPPSMQAARRQQPARQQYGAQTAKPSGKQVGAFTWPLQHFSHAEVMR